MTFCGHTWRQFLDRHSGRRSRTRLYWVGSAQTRSQRVAINATQSVLRPIRFDGRRMIVRLDLETNMMMIVKLDDAISKTLTHQSSTEASDLLSHQIVSFNRLLMQRPSGIWPFKVLCEQCPTTSAPAFQVQCRWGRDRACDKSLDCLHFSQVDDSCPTRLGFRAASFNSRIETLTGLNVYDAGTEVQHRQEALHDLLDVVIN